MEWLWEHIWGIRFGFNMVIAMIPIFLVLEYFQSSKEERAEYREQGRKLWRRGMGWLERLLSRAQARLKQEKGV